MHCKSENTVQSGADNGNITQEDYAYIDTGYGDPDETSFNSWDLDRNGQVTYEEWWRVEGAYHQQMC